jgi:ABC-type transport system substrate-binding protein
MTTIDFSALWRPLGMMALGALLALPTSPVQAAGTLRIAMTAADVPLPNGQTDQGAEGMRFMGYTVFEALVGYDLSSASKPVTLISGLATGWTIDAKDKTRWTFTLRPGVKFHDGSPFNAQAVVWNLDKILNQQD